MTATLILAGISALCWFLYFYPYIFYPLCLRLLSRKPIQAAPVDLSASLLFCACNEMDCLPGKIKNLRDLKRNSPSLQILVFDDASTDGTYELLAGASDLLTVIRGSGRVGKAAGMKQLVECATGDILAFTDADVALAPDSIERLLPYYADAEIGGVNCTVRMLCDSHTATCEAGSLYWSWDDRLQQLESATGNVMGASGALFSVRRELYPEFPTTVQDDFTVSMGVIFQGKRLIKAPDVIASTNGVSRRDEELRRKVRIGTRAYHTHSILRPQLKRMSRRDRFKYVSRKMLRWFGGLWIALGTTTGVAAIATMSLPLAGLLLLVLLVVAILSGWTQSGRLGRLGQVAVATFAIFYGVVQGMRGRTMTTWAHAKSR